MPNIFLSLCSYFHQFINFNHTDHINCDHVTAGDTQEAETRYKVKRVRDIF